MKDKYEKAWKELSPEMIKEISNRVGEEYVQDINWKEEIESILEAVKESLQKDFGKTEKEAKSLLQVIDIGSYVLHNPIMLNHAAEKWALIILTHVEDVEAIERFYDAKK